MKTTLALSMLLASSASAFTTPTQPKSSLSLYAETSSKYDSMIGVSYETNNKCPPLGAQLLDQFGPDATTWFQVAEIKHCRVAMLATVGFINQKLGVHFPLYGGPTGSNGFNPVSDVDWYLSPSQGITFSELATLPPLEAVTKIPGFGWVQLIAFAGWFELIVASQGDKFSDVPGDFGYDPLGFTKREGGLESDELKSLRLKEIKNGRLAMIAIAGWVADEAIPGAFPLAKLW